MVLIVLLGLNGQNNEGRSLFDKGSTNREKMGAKRLIRRVSEQEMVCGISTNRLTEKKLTTAGQLNGSRAVAVRGL